MAVAGVKLRLCGLLFVLLQRFQCVNPLFVIGQSSHTLLKCHTCSGYDLDHCQDRICQGRMNICFYEEVKHNDGKTYYLAGCALDSTCPANNPIVYSTGADGGKICRQCCRSNFCNMRNCDPLAANKPTPGYNDRRCFSCNGENDVQSCSRTEICKQGEHCYLQVEVNGNHLSYHGGCIPSTNCTSLHVPLRNGQNICSQCCTEDFCNSDVCTTTVGEYLKSLNEVQSRRECYQCYDQRLDEISRCLQKVTCSSSTSKCSSIMRNESGILTLDLDCEETLPCSSVQGNNHVCGQCCNWDSCNRDIDCRYRLLFVLLQRFQCVNPLFVIGQSSHTLLKCHTCSGYDLDHCQDRICQGRMNICFYEEVKHNDGKTYYLAGCALDSTCPANNPIVYSTGADGGKICRQCCRSNFCNMRNCDPLAANKPTPGYNDRRCFSCNGENDVQSCSRTEICKQGEHCYLQVEVNGNHLSYHGGCIPSTNCTSLHVPLRNGQNICSQCCTEDFCNSDVCTTTVGEYLKSLNEVQSRRECYQCYDQRLDEISRCLQKVTCSSSTSKCSSIMRNESGILTLDLDCEETLPCSSVQGNNHVCGQCCNWDSCNRDIDCRYPIQLTTASTRETTVDTTIDITTAKIVQTPFRECFLCSDLRLTPRGDPQLCGKTTTCVSKCASVYREENGIVSVDLGCEENLSCDVNATDGRLCSSCCDTDRCNDFEDCRAGSPVTTRSPPHQGVECEVCNGSSCGLNSGNSDGIICNNTAPFCLNNIVNDINGDKHITKRCGTVEECESSWLQKSSRMGDCINLDPSSIYSHDFECTYCCVTHNCNRNIRPHNSTLYKNGMYT